VKSLVFKPVHLGLYIYLIKKSIGFAQRPDVTASAIT
jgi:hypothetical protein